MPYRRFMDSRGLRWRVWDVVPSLIDQRVAARRLRAVSILHPERRVLPTRRVDPHRARLYFPRTETGWLCFESERDRRRLRPIPQGWAHDSDRALEELCERADPEGAQR